MRGSQALARLLAKTRSRPRTVRITSGDDWSLPAIPIHELTETGVTFEDNQAGLYEASVVGTIEFVTGDMEAVMKVSGKSGKLENFYSLKCKPTQRMF